jgi:arginine-tRNA-protein transferase
MNQTTFLDDVIDERYPMEVLEPTVFDDFLSNGWRLLGQSLVRHNFSVCRGEICKTIPLRIRLDDFEPSKSQRQLLRRNAVLTVKRSPIRFSQKKSHLFGLHTKRLQERQPASLASFLNPRSALVPVKGQEWRVFLEQQFIACSFFHLGEQAVSGTYCIFDPAYGQFSLGTYTMLLELMLAKELGKKYYYHGYTYNVPSQFDYKLNFEALESFKWTTGEWGPEARLPVRRWNNLITE